MRLKMTRFAVVESISIFSSWLGNLSRPTLIVTLESFIQVPYEAAKCPEFVLEKKLEMVLECPRIFPTNLWEP